MRLRATVACEVRRCHRLESPLGPRLKKRCLLYLVHSDWGAVEMSVVNFGLLKKGWLQFDASRQKDLWHIASETEQNVCLYIEESPKLPRNSMSAENIERREYRKPPIVEKVCQFVLPPDVYWDTTIPGLIYDKVLPKGFRRREPGMLRPSPLAASSQRAPQMQQPIEGGRFWTEDNTKFVEVFPRMLGIHCLKPCPTWEELEPMIKELCGILDSVTRVENFQAISLIYVNRIEIPLASERFNINDYFELKPSLGEYLPKDMVSFIVGCVFPFHNQRDMCKVQLQSAIPESRLQRAFLLRLEYILAKPKAVSVTDSLGWIKNAHENIVTTFEECIKAPLRDVF
jgi:uncharacterized protein (TIGR04255 family)